MKLPNELTVTHGDDEISVRFCYDPGERQWFDARAGVGSPGHDPFVEITEVKVGDAWVAPDDCAGLDIESLEQKVLERLGELEADYNAAREEAEYNLFNERVA